MAVMRRNSPAYLQAEDAFRRGAGAKPSFEADRPWPTIRQDAQAAVEAIVVSHRVRKKVSGPLHKDTVYGDTGREEVSRGASSIAILFAANRLSRFPRANWTTSLTIASGR